MSRRTNFIDGNDNFRDQNLRFVRNELEDNINQYFNAGNGGAGGSVAGQTGNGPPARDSRIVQPTPGNNNNNTNIELDLRRQFLCSLGVGRQQAHAIATKSLKVPDFNMREIRRQRYRMSVEAGDSHQASVNALIVRQITAKIDAYEQRLKDRPRTPPPPSDINWNPSREVSPHFREISRKRAASPKHFEPVRRGDGNFRGQQPQQFERNEHIRGVNQNQERIDNIHRRNPNQERVDNRRMNENQERVDNTRGMNPNQGRADNRRMNQFQERVDNRRMNQNQERVDNVRGMNQNRERADNVRGRNQNQERVDNVRGRNLNQERVDNVRGRNQNQERVDNVRGRNHNRQRVDNIRGMNLSQERVDNVRGRQPQNFERNESLAERQQVFERENNISGRQSQNSAGNDHFRGVEQNLQRDNHFRGRQNLERNDHFPGGEPNFERVDNFSGRQPQNSVPNDNFRRGEQNVERENNSRGRRMQNFERENNSRGRPPQNFEREDNARGRQPQNFERNGNFSETMENFERDDNFRGRQQQNFCGEEHFNRSPNFENFGVNQRNVDREEFSDNNAIVFNNQHQPNDSDFGLNRRHASPDHFHEQGPRNFDRNFDRNFENSNINDCIPNNQDIRAGPRHLQDSRFNADNNEQSFCIDRNPNFDDRNDRFHNNDHNEGNFGSAPDFEGNMQGHQSNNFVPMMQDNFPHKIQTFFHKDRFNSEYNALLDNEGRLANERRNFPQDFNDGTDINFNGPADFESGQMTNDNPRSYNFSGDNNRHINQANFGELNNSLAMSQVDNRNQLQPMHQARSNSLGRATRPQSRTIRAANAVSRIQNKPKIQNRSTSIQTNMRNQQKPPNRAVDSTKNKPPIVASTSNQAKTNITNRGPIQNKPTTVQANKPNLKQSPNRAGSIAQTQVKPGLNSIAPKRAAESNDSGPPSKVEKKKRNIAIRRGFLVGGFKLPYINNHNSTLPQPEEDSYAVTFFEQKPFYSTSVFGTGHDEDAPLDSEDDGDDDSDNEIIANKKNMPKSKKMASAIRKRINKDWKKLYHNKNYKCWQTWWKTYKWCELELNKKLEKFGSVNVKNSFLPTFPYKTTEQVINAVMKSAHFALEKNTNSHYRNAKTLYMLMNETFLENLSPPIIEQLQDMIRGTHNHLWKYKMRTMVYLWAEYYKIMKATDKDTAALRAIMAKWKSPVFHWICKQAFDELKAISAIEWPEHSTQYSLLE